MKLYKKTITIAGIDRVLKYLPIFTQANYRIAEYDQGVLKDCVNTLPYYEYDSEVHKFINVLYAEGFIHPFNDLPFWHNEAGKYYSNPDLLKTADLETIAKLLTINVRKERFCEGHLYDTLKIDHRSLFPTFCYVTT